MKVWIQTFLKDFSNLLYWSSLDVFQELLQTGLRWAGDTVMGLDKNDTSQLCWTEKTYLCAEFGESFFIQICLFIDSGFVPELKSMKKNVI